MGCRLLISLGCLLLKIIIISKAIGLVGFEVMRGRTRVRELVNLVTEGKPPMFKRLAKRISGSLLYPTKEEPPTAHLFPRAWRSD